MTRSPLHATGLRIVVALLVAAVPIGAVATAGGIGTPGSDGIGDSYFPLAGNGGYDVGHYRLDVRYAPATDRLFGRATITATATQALSRFDLDLIGLRITSLAVDGDPATWDRVGQELIVTPASPILDGAGFEVVVRYRGIPRSPLSYGARAGAIPTDDGVLIYGEPDVAAYWFPSNDHPRDKASFEIELTVPRGLKAISNGRLMGREPAGNGRVTWTWKENSPMATYLAMAVIGRFELDRYRTSDGIRVLDAFDPRVGRNARRSIGKSERVLRFLEARFGPYPFDDLGGIVDIWSGGFALENQTRPTYPALTNDARSLVVHELAHQWYGDDVALAGWQHIWLNEGFATYVEWLWSEQQGSATAQDLFDFYYEIVFPEGDPFWTLPIGDPGPDSLFDFAVYARGAMTLHELRLAVGDDAFFEILHRWAVDNAGGNVTTADFVQLSEQVSGQDLDDLFDSWLFLPERPPLGLGAASVTAAGSGLSATLDGSGVAGSAPVVARVQLQRAGLTGSR